MLYCARSVHRVLRRGRLASGACAPTALTDWQRDGGAKHVVGNIMPLLANLASHSRQGKRWVKIIVRR